MRRLAGLAVATLALVVLAMACVGQSFAEQKQSYQAEVESRVREIERGMKNLRVRVSTATGEARQRLEDRIEKLELLRDNVRGRLAMVPEASSEVWDDLKSSIEGSLNDLEAAYQAAVEEFR